MFELPMGLLFGPFRALSEAEEADLKAYYRAVEAPIRLYLDRRGRSYLLVSRGRKPGRYRGRLKLGVRL